MYQIFTNKTNRIVGKKSTLKITLFVILHTKYMYVGEYYIILQQETRNRIEWDRTVLQYSVFTIKHYHIILCDV